MNYFIAREGWPFIGAAVAIFVILLTVGNRPLIAVSLCAMFFVTWFFRNPERDVPTSEGVAVSPADGTVIKIESLEDGGTKVSIFMSVFNVHVNRIPVNGTVKKIEYNKGKFLVASKEKASLDNEQNAVTVADEKGREVKFVQIAGLVARRIVCYLKEGEAVRRGERFGLIRFGSRLDVYRPAGYAVKVSVGEKVKAGSTILANG